MENISLSEIIMSPETLSFEMSYGLRYRLEFCSKEGVPLRLEILKRNYVGSVTDVTAPPSPFVLNRRNDDGLRGALLIGEASISIYEGGDFTLENIYTADEREYKVNFYFNDVAEWTGYLLPDLSGREIRSTPVITLSATDCLGSLKEVPYWAANNAPYTGRQNLLTVILNCLKSTDINLMVSVMINIHCDEWSPVRPVEPPGRVLNFLQDTYIHSERFSDADGRVLSKYDVLKTTLNLAHARIMQQGGVWQINNKKQIQFGMGYMDIFSMEGFRLGDRVLSPFPIIDIAEIFTQGYNPLEGSPSSISLFSEHGRFFPLPKNNTFSGYNNGTYLNWTNHNGYKIEDTNIDVDRYDEDGEVYEYSTLNRSYPKILNTAGYGVVEPKKLLRVDDAPYMESEPIAVQYGDEMEFSISIAGIYEDPLIVVIVFEEASRAKKYMLNEDGGWRELIPAQDKNGFEYRGEILLTENFLSCIIPKPEGRTNVRPYAQVLEFTWPISKAPGRYESGNMFVRIYGHEKANPMGFPNHGNKWQMTIKSLIVNFKTRDRVPPGILYSSKVKNTVSSVKAIEEMVLFSDRLFKGKGGGVFLPVIADITSNIMNREGGLTENWYLMPLPGFCIDDERDPLCSLVVDQMRDLACKALNKVQISFDGDQLEFNGRYKLGCDGRFYMPVDGEIDYSESKVSATLIECSYGVLDGETVSMEFDIFP